MKEPSFNLRAAAERNYSRLMDDPRALRSGAKAKRTKAAALIAEAEAMEKRATELGATKPKQQTSS